jgi:hypothetical protein
MNAVTATQNWVEVECGACRARRRLGNGLYVLSLMQGVLACAACRRIGGVPDRRHHTVAVWVERRLPPPEGYAA